VRSPRSTGAGRSKAGEPTITKADPNHANNLGNYAVFLQNKRQNFDRAEEFYKRAIEADPNHANALRNYASFLGYQRKDFDRAAQFYKRAARRDQ
jgi:Tfp pilus assembly protein PilF